MRIRLNGWKKRPEVVRFIRWLETIIPIKHHVTIVRTTRLYGYCDAREKENYDPVIIAVDDDAVLVTIAHELCHYEQWRDRRKMTERGVEQRAKALVRRWRREAA